ncbi:MAG: hypothetical protein LW630_12185, partial [Saprospiraceae bacterium]|nr:hypothetical protein [Saprospiraceae bacterium]
MSLRNFLVIFIITNIHMLVKAQDISCNIDTAICHLNKKFDSDLPIQIEKKWELIDEVPVIQTPILFDTNNDCIPELIVSGYKNYNSDWNVSNQILIIETKNKEITQTINSGYFYCRSNNYLILKNGLSFEIVVAVSDLNINPINLRGKLVCYRADNTIKWISDQKYGGANGQSGTLSVADFNQDSTPEIYIYNNIFNSANGVLLLSGGNEGIGGVGFVSHTIAANLDNNSNDLELAAGFTTYKVSITNLNGLVGNSITPNNVLINGLGRDGHTFVADINNDQKLDVIVVTAQNVYSGIYVYTYQNNNYEIITKIDWPFYTQLDFFAIGSVTNVGTSDILINSRNEIRKFSYNNSTLLSDDWSFGILDGSARIGCSLFDFNKDGIQEIIYRDEERLNLLTAKNNLPQINTSIPCKSITGDELPIVADIDGSGEATICVTCAANINDRNGKLTIFGPPPGQRWAPARKIWHQYAYNPLFINDDGTVPQYMQNPATYKNGKYN